MADEAGAFRGIRKSSGARRLITMVLPPAMLCTNALRKEGRRAKSGEAPRGTPLCDTFMVLEQ